MRKSMVESVRNVGLKWNSKHGHLHAQWSVPRQGHSWADLVPSLADESEPLALEWKFDPYQGGYVHDLWHCHDIRTSGPFLVVEAWAGSGDLPYNPLDDKLLHRKFGDVQTMEDVMKFANTFGTLGFSIHGPYILGDGRTFVGLGEPYRLWLHETTNVRTLLQVWQVLQEPWSPASLHALRDTLNLADHDFLNSRRGWELKRWLASPVLDSFPPGRENAPISLADARLAFHEFINDELNSRILIKISPDENLYFLVVKNLLAAIYVSLANEVLGHTRPSRRCEYCTGYLDDRARSDAKFCSAACRQGHHLQAKAKARAESRAQQKEK